jgi:hypothetical protein
MDRAEVDGKSGARLLADGRHTPNESPPNVLKWRFALSKFRGSPLQSFGR